MPPKKKQEQAEQPILLGRLGTNLKCGIVGLPNVGCVILWQTFQLTYITFDLISCVPVSLYVDVSHVQFALLVAV